MSEKNEVIDDGRGEPEQGVAAASPAPQVTPRSRRTASEDSEASKSAGIEDSWVANTAKVHPSKRLDLRARGYGIAAGYEKPYKREIPRDRSGREDSYGSVPHSGYYGAGEASRPFRVGQAGFKEELEWYRSQYGRETSGYGKKEKSG